MEMLTFLQKRHLQIIQNCKKNQLLTHYTLVQYKILKCNVKIKFDKIY